jgi:hypothetical protein
MTAGMLRALSVEPTTTGFAYALLEGSERLVDWGLAELRHQSRAALESRLSKLLRRAAPDVVIIEDVLASRKGTRSREKAHLLLQHAARFGVEGVVVSRLRVRRMFAACGTSSWDVAVAVSRWFPELEPWLPRKRRPWESADRRIGIFAAAGVALTYLREHEWGWAAAA